MLTTLAVAVAFGFELATGEPPERLHPVAWFGRAVAPLDRPWRRPRLVGTLAAVALPLAAAAVVAAVVWSVARFAPVAGAVVAGGWLFAATSLRLLLSEARSVVAASESDVERARANLPALVGRDPAELSPGQIRSAAVESAAENLADGLVAPLGAFAVAALLARPFGPSVVLAVAAGAAVWVKAVNTLDSMLGYRSKPVGWGPARADDIVMWVPARVCAGLLAAACARPLAPLRARPWLADLASPNAGWPMGTVAAAVDVRLEKPGVYVLNPDADLPSVADARRAVRRVGLAGLLAYALAGVVTWS
ncbi:MAG: CobD/CbiB family cobalamin biosynthesis protein [Haloarculaceae archaeon]